MFWHGGIVTIRHEHSRRTVTYSLITIVRFKFKGFEKKEKGSLDKRMRQQAGI